MKAGKMTNEELAHNLHATIPFLTKEARHVTDADEIMREAATRLLNQGEIAVKDAEIARLRALVKELADELSKFHAWEEARALVARAMEVINTISQPNRGARRNAETTEAIDPPHSAVRKG